MDPLQVTKVHFDTNRTLASFAIAAREECLLLKGASIEATKLRIGTKSTDRIWTCHPCRRGHPEALLSSSSSSPEIPRHLGRGKPNKILRAAPEPVPATDKANSILCQNCEGNGAVVCSQCKGGGLNAEDHFGGRFKAGTICWLCRG